tara:strand:- start:2798 stop:3097 length:300 start_codon:yes stop_codon:yes gene_type:complete
MKGKDTKEQREQQISTLLILATFKSLHEQLYNLKGTNSGIVKHKFNLLLTTFKGYERLIDRDWLKDNTKAVDDLHDAITDLIYMLRNGVIKEPSKKAKK